MQQVPPSERDHQMQPELWDPQAQTWDSSALPQIQAAEVGMGILHSTLTYQPGVIPLGPPFCVIVKLAALIQSGAPK
ncbi:hypothetical protein CEP53_011991 [Fusarium sp. AF-6]|nr:hypothetical protein CEP53_011991 [Fusarium sp. AF-6]